MAFRFQTDNDVYLAKVDGNKVKVNKGLYLPYICICSQRYQCTDQ